VFDQRRPPTKSEDRQFGLKSLDPYETAKRERKRQNRASRRASNQLAMYFSLKAKNATSSTGSSWRKRRSRNEINMSVASVRGQEKVPLGKSVVRALRRRPSKRVGGTNPHKSFMEKSEFTGECGQAPGELHSTRGRGGPQIIWTLTPKITFKSGGCNRVRQSHIKREVVKTRGWKLAKKV